MSTFDQEKAYVLMVKKVDRVTNLLETLTIVTAITAGISSTKIREILKMDQTEVSNISKHIIGRAQGPAEIRKKK